MRSIVATTWILGLVACASAGCGGGRAAEQDALDQLKQELTRTRGELDQTRSQVEDLSRRLFLLSDRVERNNVELSRSQPPPRLKVVTLTPTAIPAAPVAPRQDAPPPSAESLYKRGLGLYRAHQYDDAEVVFLTFLSYYPAHEYSDNAYYWMGESRFDRKQYQQAVEAFLAVVERFPEGNKVPDALLKLAYSYQALEKPDQALMTLKELAETYPRSIPAKKARARLMELDPSEG